MSHGPGKGETVNERDLGFGSGEMVGHFPILRSPFPPFSLFPFTWAYGYGLVTT